MLCGVLAAFGKVMLCILKIIFFATVRIVGKGIGWLVGWFWSRGALVGRGGVGG